MAYLRQVTISEVGEWLKKNPHVTWSPESFGPEHAGKPGLHRAKYLDVRIDTRTMTVFRLELTGTGGSTIVVDFRDSNEGSLLDELDRRLTEDGK